MGKFLTRNNVKTTLAEDITPTTTQFRIFKATPPFKTPPSPSPPYKVRLTIVDSENPTKIEIVEAETVMIDGPDHRLITVTNNDPNDGRGLEQTTAESFSAGAIIYMANTADMIDAKADREDVVIVKREVVSINGTDYLEVKTQTPPNEWILFFRYKL
jgi:hypothetical protein